MILFISDGRLGNQLFQYAFLKTICKDNEKIICINMTEINNCVDIEDPSLLQFNPNRLMDVLLRKIVKAIFLNIIRKMRIIGYVNQIKYERIFFSLYKETRGLLNIKLIETDFFQSEKFFDSQKFNYNIKEKYIEEAKIIINNLPYKYNYIFIHIRRGDYLDLEYGGTKGIELPKVYFEKAMGFLNMEVRNPFYIFLSDDPAYVAINFKNIKNKYISRNSMYVDFALMTMCEYGIVSNSSFSWWGAYLMKNRKRVIFPKYWYGWKNKINSHINIQPDWATILDVD